jgi:hypothetical protein
MDRVRAGHPQRECRNRTIDDDQRTAVPRELEAGKGQDVRALPLGLASTRAALVLSSQSLCNSITDSMQWTPNSSPLPHPP